MGPAPCCKLVHSARSRAHWETLERSSKTQTSILLRAHLDDACSKLRRTLEVLQDRVEPKPFPAVDRVIRRELGAGAEELFAEFDQQATAAASLAQALYLAAHCSLHSCLLLSGAMHNADFKHISWQALISRPSGVCSDVAKRRAHQQG